MDNKKKHKFSIIPKYSEVPYPSGPEFENDRGDIVYYGQDNKFPSLLIELYHKSSVHSTAINSKHQSVVGQGLTGLDEDILKVANKEIKMVDIAFPITVHIFISHTYYNFQYIL